MFRLATPTEIDFASRLSWDREGIAWEGGPEACARFATSADGDLEGLLDAPQREALHGHLRARGPSEVVTVYWRAYSDVRFDLAPFASVLRLGDEEYLIAGTTLDDVDVPFLGYGQVHECVYPEWMWARDLSWMIHVDKDGTYGFLRGAERLVENVVADPVLRARRVACV